MTSLSNFQSLSERITKQSARRDHLPVLPGNGYNVMLSVIVGDGHEVTKVVK